MEHSVEIVFDERFLARPWGVVCQRCGKVGAGASREEAERILEAHLERIGGADSGSRASA